jgi:hypothetical protein
VIGRFDPAAASGLLRIDPGSGAATVQVRVAGETGATQPRPGQRWVAGLHPGPSGTSENIRLCDGCLAVATGQVAECEDGCPQDPDHAGLCLRTSPDECQWCGTPGRLHEVSRADVIQLLPTLGSDTGLWFLNWADGRRGPYPSAQAAWDDWHGGPPALRRVHPANPPSRSPGEGG